MKKISNHRRIMKIGNMLVKGPDAIFRISEGDWLEKSLHIIIKDAGMKNMFTYSLWSDGSMNKDSDFLPPMVRILRWRKREDLDELVIDKKRKFPKVEIELGTIKSSKYDEVNKSFVDLQSTFVKSLDFIPYKISTERDSVESNVDYNQNYLTFTIYFSNGNQFFEYIATGNTKDLLVREIISFRNLLTESIDLIEKSEWKERYYKLTEEYLDGETPEWYYRNEMN